MRRRLVFLLILGVAGQTGFARSDDSRPVVAFAHAVVAADHPLASEAGLEMLQQGGNVVDAAVATAFALSVLRPEGCGIGGGGFMLIHDASIQTTVAIDYREQAPAAAYRDMFLDADGEPIAELSRHGGLAVAVPCEVKGLCLALERYGTLDLPTVLAPAIRLAEQSVPVDRQQQTTQQLVIDDIGSAPIARKHSRHCGSTISTEEQPTNSAERFIHRWPMCCSGSPMRVPTVFIAETLPRRS